MNVRKLFTFIFLLLASVALTGVLYAQDTPTAAASQAPAVKPAAADDDDEDKDSGSSRLSAYVTFKSWIGWLNQSNASTSYSLGPDKTMDTSGRPLADRDTDFGYNLKGGAVGAKGKVGSTITVQGEVGFDPQEKTMSDTMYKSYRAKMQQLKIFWNVTPDVVFFTGYTDIFFKKSSKSVADDNGFKGFGRCDGDSDFQTYVKTYGVAIGFANPYKWIDDKLYNQVGNGIGSSKDTDRYIDVTLPRLFVWYEFKMIKNLKVTPQFWYQQTTIDAKTYGTTDPVNPPADLAKMDGKTYRGWLAEINVDAKLLGFNILANAGYSINGGIIGLKGVGYTKFHTSLGSNSDIGLSTNPYFDTSSTTARIYKNTHLEGYIDIGKDLGFIHPRAGIGYAQSQLDIPDSYSYSGTAVNDIASKFPGNKVDRQIAYYAQVQIPVVKKTLIFVPEILYRDFMKDSKGIKQGNQLLIGVYIKGTFGDSGE
jgi:hypothetical protein